MSHSAEQKTLTPEEVKQRIWDYITDEIDVDNVVDIDHQCGGCWIDFKDGTTMSLSFIDCEGGE